MRGIALGLALAGALFSATLKPPGFQLSDSVVPLSYQVSLSIDPARDTFDGTVEIELDARTPVSTIWLNAKDIEPGKAQVGGEAAHARVTGKELIAIDIPHPISGSNRLSLEYRGRIDDKGVLGAYRRKLDGEWYVYTTFTPIEARRAIPCFDEPRFKTPWQISIQIPQGDRAFSNGAEMSEQSTPDGRKWVRFHETRPLPAELVAFAVGPFDVYQGQPAGHGTAVRVITPKALAQEGAAAAAATAAVLPRLEAYTGIPYQFGKLDELALADGAFGAVENPGLITFLDRELLMVPGSETIPRTRTLRLLEAHELGHQWFGDLVTQKDWDDVWLSEGFATWISEKVMDEEEPPARAHIGLMEARERIMQADDSRRSRPVRVAPVNREGARDIYNRFVYDKGASVLLMLEGWLGEDKIRQGLQAYLRDHRFQNASTADLAAELKRASGVDPSAVMHSFLDLAGLPRVSIQVECGPRPQLRIRQTGAAAIPICYRGRGAARACTVLDSASRDVELPRGASCPAWIVPNAGATGYYRTTWTTAQLASLPLEQLTPAERLMLAFDLRSMLNAPAADRQAARAMLARLASDSEPEVRQAAQDAAK